MLVWNSSTLASASGRFAFAGNSPPGSHVSTLTTSQRKAPKGLDALRIAAEHRRPIRHCRSRSTRSISPMPAGAAAPDAACPTSPQRGEVTVPRAAASARHSRGPPPPPPQTPAAVGSAHSPASAATDVCVPAPSPAPSRRASIPRLQSRLRRRMTIGTRTVTLMAASAGDPVFGHAPLSAPALAEWHGMTPTGLIERRVAGQRDHQTRNVHFRAAGQLQSIRALHRMRGPIGQSDSQSG